MVSQSLEPLPNQEQPPNKEASLSSGSDAPMLASILDVSIVDNYLLQSYIVPSFIQAIVWFRKALISSHEAGRIVWNSAADSTDASMIPLSRMVRCLIPLVSLWITRGRTPAMRQMGLEFKGNPLKQDQNRAPLSIQWRLMIYAVLQFVLPELYLWIRKLLQRRIQQLSSFGPLNVNHAEDSPSIPSDPKAIARQRQRAVLEQIDRMLEQLSRKVIPMLQLITLVFCWSGILHTAEPALIVSGLTYQRRSAANAPPKLHLALAHRRWLMHHVIETFRIVVLPSLILVPRIWKPLLHRYYSSIHTSTLQHLRCYIRLLQPKDSRQPKVYDSEETAVCPLCNCVPRTVAVQADCTCRQIYCYACFYHSIILPTTDPSTTAVVKHISSTTTANTNASYTIPTLQKHVRCVRCHEAIQKVNTISRNSNASKKVS